MKVLVTGATGFLGNALTAALKNRGDDVVSVNSKIADLRQAQSLDQFNQTRFDRIFHLAAWTQAGDFCLRHPGEQWTINQQINTNVLTWWHQKQPQAKLIAIGTSCSYDPSLPLVEDQYLNGRPIDSLFTYAMTKRMMYAGLLAFQKQFSLSYLHVVPSTLFGPSYHTDGRQMHFIFDLIRKMIRGKVYGEPIILWGDGHQRRELVLVDDFVANLLALDAKAVNETFNLGAGSDHSIRDFADMICRKLQMDPSMIQYDTSKYVGARSKCLDIGKARACLGGYRLTPLQTGLDATIDWFWNHRHELVAR